MLQDVMETRGYDAEIYHPIGTLYLAAKLFKTIIRICFVSTLLLPCGSGIDSKVVALGEGEA